MPTLIKPTVEEPHKLLINFMLKLGYKVTPGGICFGISRMFKQALALGTDELKLFNKLIKDIEDINKGKKKNILDNSITLNENEKQEKVNLLAFLDAICLYQDPYNNYPLDRQSQESPMRNQRLLEKNVFQLVKPVLCDDQKDYTSIGSFSSYYNIDKGELKSFLIQLQQNIAIIAEKSLVPIFINLDSIGHSIGIGYLPELKKYYFVDANQLELMEISFDSLEELEKYIIKGFNFKKLDKNIANQDKTLILHVNVEVFANDTKKINKINLTSNNAPTSNRKSSITGDDYLLFVIFYEDDLHVLKKLLKVYHLNENEKIELLRFAIVHNRNQAVKILFPVAAQSEKLSLLQFAVENERYETVKLLLGFFNQTNLANDKVTELFFSAIKNGNIEMIKIFLESKKFTIDGLLSKDGKSPLELAISLNKSDIVDLLKNLKEDSKSLDDLGAKLNNLSKDFAGMLRLLSIKLPNRGRNKEEQSSTSIKLPSISKGPNI